MSAVVGWCQRIRAVRYKPPARCNAKRSSERTISVMNMPPAYAVASRGSAFIAEPQGIPNS